MCAHNTSHHRTKRTAAQPPKMGGCWAPHTPKQHRTKNTQHSHNNYRSTTTHGMHRPMDTYAVGDVVPLSWKHLTSHRQQTSMLTSSAQASCQMASQHPSLIWTGWLRNGSSDRPWRCPTSGLMRWTTLRLMELALPWEIRSRWRHWLVCLRHRWTTQAVRHHVRCW